eukprot:SAG22_NODE_311_length_12629_cov_20.911891_4_plen_164_part_00
MADNDKCMQNCTYPTVPWPHGGDYDCTDLVSHKALPLCCASTVFLSKTVPFCAVQQQQVNNRVCWGGAVCTTNCYPTESIENNFIVLRSMAGSEFGNTLYAEFATGDAGFMDINFTNLSFVEFYEMETDPWMMKNKIGEASTPKDKLHAELHRWFGCAGASCP